MTTQSNEALSRTGQPGYRCVGRASMTDFVAGGPWSLFCKGGGSGIRGMVNLARLGLFVFGARASESDVCWSEGGEARS